MSYGADFAHADPANAPLNPVIFIGAEPSFWAGILLALLAALFFGWFLGNRASRNHADAAHAIWQAIHDATRSAMGADDNALKGKAEALRRVIDERLGKTLKLAGGLSGRIKKLDDAIAGKGPVQSGGGAKQATPDTAGGHGGHGGGGGGNGPKGESGHAGHGGGGGGGGAAASAAASVTVVTIGGPVTAAPVATTPPVPPVGDLSHREQTDALRLAVAAFNQHWRDETARVGELRDAHAELSNTGPAHKSSGHGKDSHGGH